MKADFINILKMLVLKDAAISDCITMAVIIRVSGISHNRCHAEN